MEAMPEAKFQRNYEKDGRPDGGVAYGPGYTITWQRGPLLWGRNGALLLDIVDVIINQINDFQVQFPDFACEENESALLYLQHVREALVQRRDRRLSEGKLGTLMPD